MTLLRFETTATHLGGQSVLGFFPNRIARLSFCVRFTILSENGGMRCLVDLLLLVDAELAWAAVDKQQETTNDGQDLEEVVLGKVLVRVVLVELN